MKKMLLAVLVGMVCLIPGRLYAVSVNPTSNILCDSANTGETCIYRDTTGSFNTSTASTTAGGFAASSSTTANYPARWRGSYTTTQLQTLVAEPGEVVLNITLGAVCTSTATTTGLAGAWTLPRSTSTTANLIQCY